MLHLDLRPDSPSAHLAALVGDFNLLDHPFYQAWGAGELSEEQLASYASQYAVLIDRIPDGWRIIGDDQHAALERHHCNLWRDFAGVLGVTEFAPRHPQLVALANASDRLFATRATALGALFAFEAQQPFTSESKLTGLRRHYPHLATPKAIKYFTVHAKDLDEVHELAAKYDELSHGDRIPIMAACREMLKRMWDALSDLHQNPMMATA